MSGTCSACAVTKATCGVGIAICGGALAQPTMRAGTVATINMLAVTADFIWGLQSA